MPYQTYCKQSFHSWSQYSMFIQMRQRLQTLFCYEQHKFSITNKLTNKSCLTSGGKCNTTDTIYGAECTKHNLIYEGRSSQKLSRRFNGHSSDVKVKPNARELSQHFHESKNCKIEKDLKVYILQNNATGTREKREFIDDRWTTRLNT